MTDQHPRRVLMTADTIGGVWTFAMELTAELMSRGIDVCLATAGRALSRDQRKQAMAAGDPEVFESDFRLEWQEDPWGDVDRAGDWLQNIADRVRPDVLHLNDYSNASRDWDMPVVVTAHSCVLSWFAAVKGTRAPSPWNTYWKRVAMGLHSADIVTAPSRAMLECIEEHYGPVGRCMVVPNGRRAQQFRPAMKQPFIFAAGRVWDEAKNIAALTTTAGDLTWPVYVAGEMGQASFPNVKALGLLGTEELASWMSRASIYCLPAKYEPFGYSILEAALSGCALVLGDIASLREIWGDCACFVDPADTDGLKQTLKELIGSTDRRKALAEEAHRRAQGYCPECMAAGYLSAYSAAMQWDRTLQSSVKATA